MASYLTFQLGEEQNVLSDGQLLEEHVVLRTHSHRVPHLVHFALDVVAVD